MAHISDIIRPGYIADKAARQEVLTIRVAMGCRVVSSDRRLTRMIGKKGIMATALFYAMMEMNLFDAVDTGIAELRRPEWLDDIDIETEYKLIQQKTSELPRAKREVVVRMWEYSNRAESDLNCIECHYKKISDGGYCYMWENKPAECHYFK